MDTEELTKNSDVAKIAKEGMMIYENVRSQYEPVHTGEFLAIEIESEDVYLASTSAEAVVKARKAHPDTLFYVVKIGFDAAEAMSLLFPER